MQKKVIVLLYENSTIRPLLSPYSSDTGVCTVFEYSLSSLVIMGRKKNTSYNIRQLAIFHSAKGKSYREIAAMLNISKVQWKILLEGLIVKIG